MSKQFVDVTPKWVEILPTWLMLFEQAIEGNCSNPDLVKDNARAELRRMAEAADRWNQSYKAAPASNFTEDQIEQIKFMLTDIADNMDESSDFITNWYRAVAQVASDLAAERAPTLDDLQTKED